MKSPNCNSTMDFVSQIDKPIAISIIEDSHIGVFLTLSFPYFSTKPSVILKTPPYSAISWPIITSELFFFIASSNPSEIASTNLRCFVLVEAGDSTKSNFLKTSESCNSISVSG